MKRLMTQMMPRGVVQFLIVTAVVVAGMVTYSPAAAQGGTVNVVATDNVGAAETVFRLQKYNPETHEYENYGSSSGRRSDGKYSFTAEPGTYRLLAEYRETYVPQTQTIDNIEIGEGAEVEQTLYFEKGSILVEAVDAGRCCRDRFPATEIDA